MIKRLIVATIFVLCLFPLSAFSFATPHQARPHCVINLAPLKAGQRFSDVLGFHCYATFSQAIAAATNGRVHLPNTVRPQDLTQAMLDSGPVGPNATYVISEEFWNWHYDNTGPTWTATGSLPCNQTGGYGDNLTGSGWNNEISSSEGFSTCNHNTHWDLVNSGSNIVCAPNCYEMGAMNDATTSIQWHT